MQDGEELPADALSRVRRRLSRGEAVVAGVLSGTSADGIDVALARFPCSSPLGSPELLAFATEPFPEALGARVRSVLDGADLSPRELAFLSRDLGHAFGRAAAGFAERTGHPLDLVGSHGQTVFHHDGGDDRGRATLQLGEPAWVAEASGACVAADFRQADLAAGGEGAPLSALADALLFADGPRPLAILNLGGMANLTVLSEHDELLAFDTGPANCLLDGLARRVIARPFDADGACALRGRPDALLLGELLEDPALAAFLARQPPKSTGRDTFGAAWVGAVLARAGARGVVAPADLLATATELVAATVARGLERFVAAPPRLLALSGGGVHNQALFRALERRCDLETVSVATLGVDPDAREGLVFCVLAARCILGIPSTAPGATGARTGTVLGALTHGKWLPERGFPHPA